MAATKRWINETNANKIIRFPANQINPILIPFALADEEALLGGLLMNPEVLACLDFLKAEDFWAVRHTYIFRAIEILDADPEIPTEAITYISVGKVLEGHGQLADIGDLTYLMKLIDGCPSSVKLEVHARMIQRCAIRRRMMAAADIILGVARDETMTVYQAIDEANRVLFEATDQQISDAHTDIASIASAYFDEFEKDIRNPKGISLPTGFREFDRKYGGLHRKEMVIVAAPPGMGKTTFAINVAVNAAKLKAPVAVFSLEMTQSELMNRILAMETGISENVIKRRDVPIEKQSLIVEAIGRVSEWPVNIIDDMRAMTPMQFRRRLRKLMQKRAFELVIIDGLWLMHSDDPADTGDYRFSNIARDLAEIAKEFNIRLLIVHQYNRDRVNRGDKRPQLTDLRGGGEQDAWLTLALHRDKDAGTTDTELITLKHRGGVGLNETIWLSFDSMKSRYQDRRGLL